MLFYSVVEREGRGCEVNSARACEGVGPTGRSQRDESVIVAPGSRLQVDEVKVFETFGGDLPVAGTTVKLESKPPGRPGEQESNIIDGFIVLF